MSIVNPGPIQNFMAEFDEPPRLRTEGRECRHDAYFLASARLTLSASMRSVEADRERARRANCRRADSV